MATLLLLTVRYWSCNSKSHSFRGNVYNVRCLYTSVLLAGNPCVPSSARRRSVPVNDVEACFIMILILTLKWHQLNSQSINGEAQTCLGEKLTTPSREKPSFYLYFGKSRVCWYSPQNTKTHSSYSQGAYAFPPALYQCSHPPSLPTSIATGLYEILGVFTLTLDSWNFYVKIQSILEF